MLWCVDKGAVSHPLIHIVGAIAYAEQTQSLASIFELRLIMQFGVLAVIVGKYLRILRYPFMIHV